MAKVRLLVCHHCESIQEIPWCGEGQQCSHPSCADALEARLSEHRFADGRPHEPGNLADIEKDLWEDPAFRKDILVNIQRIANPGAGDGLGSTYYDVKSTFSEDAFACWKRHRRTTDCGDYKTDKMKLLADTRGDRKELGLSVKASARPSTHLCDFCPVKSVRQTKVYSEKFGYNSPY